MARAMRMRASISPNVPDPGEDPGSSTCKNRQCRKKFKRMQRLIAALRRTLLAVSLGNRSTSTSSDEAAAPQQQQ
ncbi:hypothetical protein D9C73_000045 [Collichthys lucidus]|uniref:Uncharacterized protein n=1 Tax=Collichthys lucidus TaxID=240159 RepID=A0A4U5TX55_COLLU|nr:hypothetical protein D9C73_000045 [Collichthys lucidus]